MTRIITHRRNTIDLLKRTPKHHGVEVDIRTFGDLIILQHDPFIDGELFENWLNEYQHGTLILNVKEEGLEQRLLDLMQAHEIENFFFLDQSYPALIKWSQLGESRCAVRVSEFESIDSALKLSGKVEWVWVDCFTHFPLTSDEALRLTQHGFKLCLVSPELQGRDAKQEIPKLHAFLNRHGIYFDAICTKHPEIWENMMEYA